MPKPVNAEELEELRREVWLLNWDLRQGNIKKRRVIERLNEIIEELLGVDLE